jgi:phosphatidylserine/phosphatidylglycerophosphate/cardiolipin synthase-like enzyme
VPSSDIQAQPVGWLASRLGLDPILWIPAMCATLLASCARLPDIDGRSSSVTLRNTADTRLGHAVLSLARAHPGESGIVPLADGRDAFAARALLAAAAERTLDIQYYIWHGDMSGTLLFEALHRAADREVRVRLLLDDNNTAGLDSTLAALDSHPNIEVRLFNPFVHRRWRYEATDVVAVHAGYAKRRKALLEAGVRLFEMKREATGMAASNRASTGSRGSSMTGSSSASSLHAKTFSVDRSRIFIGSFNFDPRSAHLNTEMGFVIESPKLAQRVVDAFASGIPERAYEARLTGTGSLEWVEQRDGREVVHTSEPGATFWTRAIVAVLSVLPIEWLL